MLFRSIEPMSVVVHAFRKLQKGKKSLVLTGSGFLTYLATKVAHHFGYSDVAIVTSSKRNHELLSDYLYIPKPKSKLSKKYDACLDFSGNEENLLKALELLDAKAKIVMIANSREDTNILFPHREIILRRELSIEGSWNSDFGYQDDDWEEAIKLLTELDSFDYPIRVVRLSELPIYLDSLRSNVSKIANERIHVVTED